MIQEEGYPTTMDKVLKFGNESFLRLLPKIQVQVDKLLLLVLLWICNIARILTSINRWSYNGVTAN